MKHLPELEDYPSDQYSRYRACADILKRVAGRGATVLECGSGMDCLLERFLPEFNVTSLDPLLKGTLRRGSHERIGGDVFHPALDHRSFDFVVNIDTLEHIPPGYRSAFLRRISRLATHGVVIACPCADAGEAARADLYVNSVFQRTFGRPYPWLAEHLAHGLPRLADIKEQLTAEGWHLLDGQNGHVLWVPKLLAFLLCAIEIPALRAAAREVSRRFNQELYEFDHQPPGYRQVILALRGKPSRNDLLPVPFPEMPTIALERWQAIDDMTLVLSTRAIRGRLGRLRDGAQSLRRKAVEGLNRLLDRAEESSALRAVPECAKSQLKRVLFGTLGGLARDSAHYAQYVRERTWRETPTFRPDHLPDVPPPSQTVHVLLWAGTSWDTAGRERKWASDLAAVGVRLLYVEPDFVASPLPGFEAAPMAGSDSVTRIRFHLEGGGKAAEEPSPTTRKSEQLRRGIGKFLAWSASRRVVCIVADRVWIEPATWVPNSLLVIDETVAESDPPLSERERHIIARADLVGSVWSEDISADRLLHLVEPRISVIIVTYGNLGLTRACLHSVERETDHDNLELVIVDNASSDGTRHYLETWARTRSNVRLIFNRENRGFPAAANQGLRTATGEYLVLLNNDTLVTSGWTRTLMNHLRTEPNIGIIGPVTNAIGNEARIPVQYRNATEMAAVARAWCLEHLGGVFDIRTLAFFCAMFPRRVYDRVGPLDEGFGVGFFEDDDYCRRVEQLGYRIACAQDVFVHHEMAASFDKIPLRARREAFNQSRKRYESKWGLWIPPQYRRPT